MTRFDADLPPGDPDYTCQACGGSGVDPDDFGRPFLILGELRPCPDCDGRGETF